MSALGTSILFWNLILITYRTNEKTELDTSVKKSKLGERVAVDRSQPGLSQTAVEEREGPLRHSSVSQLEYAPNGLDQPGRPRWH
jgi:hypothetical protein